MRRKLGGKLEVRRETLGSLEDRRLKQVLGADSAACSTATRDECSGCDVCNGSHTCTCP